MNTKEYKFWRFAYESYIDTIKVPEDTKFYCFNKDRKELTGYKPDKLDEPVWNEHWIAVLPYTKENSLVAKKTHSYSLSTYNLNNKYIILDLEQIYPLSNDWPETDVLPELSNEYIKYRSQKLPFTDKEWTTELARIDSLNLTPDEKTEEMKNTFKPIIQYTKINGLKNGCLDITSIIVKSWLDGSDIYQILRTTSNIENVFADNSFEIYEESTKEEFDNALTDLLTKL